MAKAAARPKFDKMWRIWYAILVLALHGFLLYSAFQRYASFRSKALREQWDMSPMNFYLGMMVVALFLLPFFIYAAFVRTGNYAEDGVQVGRDRDNLKVAVAETTAAGGAGQQVASAGACLARLRRHFMPYTCLLHVLIAMCLLVPMPVLEAAEIGHAKRSKEEIWRTNLDFLYRPTASATNSISPEIFNLILALAILLVRYPSAFWFSNRVFAFLFSIILCVCGLHIVLAYEATSVLFKASMAEGVAQVNLAPPAIIILHSFGDLLLLVANIAFFEFGYAQMLANLRKYRHYLQLEASSSASDRSISSCSDDSPCWLNYAPHLVGILLMVLAVLCKAPILWDWVGLYRTHHQPAMLAAIVSGGFYLVLWVGIWFLFGFKANWKFNIRLELDFPSKIVGPGFQQQQQHQQQGSQQQLQRSSSDFGSIKRSGGGSGGGSQYNIYGSAARAGNAIDSASVSMIPTISEQVDIASESSYTCGGGSNTLERQQHQHQRQSSTSGLVKYQVRRGSTQSSASQFSGNGGGSLRRAASAASRSRGNPGSGISTICGSVGGGGGGNRVTFKDLHLNHEAILGSPNDGASSSDSGIDSSRVAMAAAAAAAAATGNVGSGAVQLGSIDDPYARVNKPHQMQQQQQQMMMQQQQQRAPSRQSNYEDYQMFGSLFNQQQQQQPQERDYYTRQEIELASSQADIYGRIGGISAGPMHHQQHQPLARIPSEDFDTYGTAAQYGVQDVDYQYQHQHQQPAPVREVPDILLSKSPYGSLNRPNNSGSRAPSAQHLHLHQQQQQQQQMLLRSSYSSLPQPPVTDLQGDHVDGLCSQV